MYHSGEKDRAYTLLRQALYVSGGTIAVTIAVTITFTMTGTMTSYLSYFRLEPNPCIKYPI
jgi:uncharacterized membrane protein